jgi:Ca2+-binding EF-hand superfamily protein
MTGAAAFIVLALTAACAQDPVPAATENNSSRQLIFLAENRPVFVRLRMKFQGRSFEASWIDSVRALAASLDRNGDGTVTVKEADPAVVNALVRLAIGAADVPALGELDVQPKDGKVSIDELTEALRPILSPFRLQAGRQAISRTDALFDQLDRDKDEQLTRPELAAIAGSLRPLDLDDDETISALELEPYNSPALTALMGESSERRERLNALPAVIELVPGESSFRPARVLLKKYDKGRGDVPGRPDGKLSLAEFAIDPEVFAEADKNSDDALDTDELRKLLGQPPIDLTLEVDFSSSAGATPATTRVEAGANLPKGGQVRRLADGEVEFAVGKVRLDVHTDDGKGAADQARRLLEQQFKAADANKNGYLEGKELAAINGPQSPLAGLAELIDRDGDGKLYLKELMTFADRQIEAARSRVVLTTDDQGRAIFGILDLDRDRRLGARELARTIDRVMSWDSDHDGRVSADEIPYHFQVFLSRGELRGLSGDAARAPVPGSMAASRGAGTPASADWFHKMDRNHDGDISRREFLGPREQFDRLDRDNDGLIDSEEARTAVPAKAGAASHAGPGSGQHSGR